MSGTSFYQSHHLVHLYKDLVAIAVLSVKCSLFQLQKVFLVCGI